MPSLTAWLYPTAFGAETGELQLKTLIERDAIQLHDAAIVVWMQHDKAPIVRRVKHRGSKAAGKGAVFGGLVGLLVLNPVAGAAIGAGGRAAAQRLHGTGLDAQFVADVREQQAGHLRAAGAVQRRRRGRRTGLRGPHRGGARPRRAVGGGAPGARGSPASRRPIQRLTHRMTLVRLVPSLS